MPSPGSIVPRQDESAEYSGYTFQDMGRELIFDLGAMAAPINAFDLIRDHCAMGVDLDQKRPGLLCLGGHRADNRQTRFEVVFTVGKYNRRAPAGLLMADLRIKIEPNHIAARGNLLVALPGLLTYRPAPRFPRLGDSQASSRQAVRQ